MNDFTITSQVNKVNLLCTQTQPCHGITEYRYSISCDASAAKAIQTPPQMPVPEGPCICLHIEKKALGIAGVWNPDSGFRRNLPGDWASPSRVNLSHGAPVLCFFDYSGKNCFTLALSEVNRDILYVAGIHEETGCLHIDLLLSIPAPAKRFDVKFPLRPDSQAITCPDAADNFDPRASQKPDIQSAVCPEAAESHYRLTCRIDCRPLPYHTAIREVCAWWDGLLPDAPMPVPDIARLPMYSTWYSYHQDMADGVLYDEYAKAAQMGMRAVIIDDGWQTADNSRGYGFCGDWEPASAKFPDFGSHVKKIHSLGMKCLVWFSVPFVGEYSGIWPRFQEKLLHFDATLHTGILDPRYADVRQYLISTYEKAVTQWDLDGLKLDFIDSFRHYQETPAYQEGMDFQEIQEAVYCLMIGIFRQLKKKKPELLIEFRQTYTGPQMRRFGNILRVADCPLSGVANRVGIADLKMISGNTAVHSDMLMWHADEPPESIAVQLIHCIFATLQISVRLHTLSPEQKSVLEHYLDFSIRYRDVLQQGDFAPEGPLALYPILSSRNRHICIIAVYDSGRIVSLPQADTLTECWILNGCTETSLTLSAAQKWGCEALVYDCMGKCNGQKTLELSGLCTLSVPAGGSLLLKKRDKAD